MSVFFRVLVLAMGLGLYGCTAGTTLILMPDESGKVGAITVKTPGDFRVIDQAYGSVILKDGTVSLSATKTLSEMQVYGEYTHLLQAQPIPPSSFIVYFKFGSADLVKTSVTSIPDIVERIKAQMPTEITIIGHTDTTGPDALNNKLSLLRARVVEKILKENIPTLHAINVQFFGAKNLLVPTAENVNEQRNRGVEILVL
ncbi:MAG: OmpA family protein [Sulfuriferula sp.]